MSQIPAHYGVTGDNVPLTGCVENDSTPLDVTKRSVTQTFSVKVPMLKLIIDVCENISDMLHHQLSSVPSGYFISHVHNCSRQPSRAHHLVLSVEGRNVPLSIRHGHAC